jgi:hypothetical protein
MDETKCDALGGKLVTGCFMGPNVKFKYRCDSTGEDGSLTIMLLDKSWTHAKAKESCKFAKGSFKKIK